MTIKEQMIRDYISNIDFHLGKWDVQQMKLDMKSFLGEEPAIDVAYVKDVAVNEMTGKSEEIHEARSMKIIFFDVDDKFKKIEFIINEPFV